MAPEQEIKRIELRRLAELEKQRAYKGIDTEPEVLLEIADLRQKYGSAATAVSRDDQDTRTVRDLWNEVDFLRAMCSGILRRMNASEANRKPRQMVQDLWMLLLTGMLLYALFLR